MATENDNTTGEKVYLYSHAWPLFRGAVVATIIGFVAALAVTLGSDEGITRFYHAYLVNFAFFLSIALGALFFVLIQHLTRAGWSVAVRRMAEVLAAAMPALAVAFAPIAVAVLVNHGELYPWANEADGQAAHITTHAPVNAGITPTSTQSTLATTSPAVHVETNSETMKSSHGHAETGAGYVFIDAHTEGYFSAKKRLYLNPAFFIARFAIYFLAWAGLALWLWRKSTLQDKTGDPALTTKMQGASAAGLWLFGITLTFGAFDLLMSLSPAWYSTIFGVYYFTGAVAAAFAAIIIILNLLQRRGYLIQSVTIEHYHDLGKFLFGFVFFWGYIAFSQYMLIWYASLPETTFWFAQRGASTDPAHYSGWSIVSLALLLGHFVIPFIGLLSRHAKRNTRALLFWACWVLVFHWIDLWWIVMPEMGTAVRFGLAEIATFVAIGGLFTATVVRLAAMHKLIPVNDPRLSASMAFENI
ncbi:MAG: hypothetical protein WD768_11440 [Phycisphaeraceae bacterium]